MFMKKLIKVFAQQQRRALYARDIYLPADTQGIGCGGREDSLDLVLVVAPGLLMARLHASECLPLKCLSLSSLTF